MCQEKYITRWKEASSEKHGQGLAHSSGQTAQNVAPVLLVNGRGCYVSLHLSSQYDNIFKMENQCQVSGSHSLPGSRADLSAGLGGSVEVEHTYP